MAPAVMRNLALHFALSEEHEMLVETVRRFVEEELYPHEALVEETDEVPDDAGRRDPGTRRSRSGSMPPTCRSSSAAAGSTRSASPCSSASSAAPTTPCRCWSPGPPTSCKAARGAQRERWLLPTIRGERHDCLAMTEPGAGSDVRSMKTRAVRQGDGYVINGQKHFISHADRADFIILFAVTGSEETKRGPAQPDLRLPGRQGHARPDGAARPATRCRIAATTIASSISTIAPSRPTSCSARKARAST